MNELKDIHNKLVAWIAEAELWASRVNEIDAIAYRKMALNYRLILSEVDVAIGRLARGDKDE